MSFDQSCFLAINFPAVSNPEDSYHFPHIINLINDSIVTEPNSPVVLGAGQFMTAEWAWIICERSNARNDTMKKRSWQGFKIALSATFYQDFKH